MEIFTDEINSESPQLYNALDTLITAEVFQNLNSLTQQPNFYTGPIYNFELALQAPVVEMQLRGIKVDIIKAHEMIKKLTGDQKRIEEILKKLVTTLWDRPWEINKKGQPTFINSNKQLIEFFYDTIGLKRITQSKKGEQKTPMDREILERLSVYFQTRPIISCLLAHRDISGKLEVLQAQKDSDNRMRCSINIAATTTGRFSTSQSTTGSGMNLQNITEDLRHIFIADDGYKIAGIDKEQAESREVGYFCGITFDDWSYLDAIESGDIHTYCAQLIWRNLPWTSDKKTNRQIAEQPFYRHLTYRDMVKRCSHGCLTQDHEVLTPNGWVSVSNKPEIIMQFSPFSSRFEKVSNWIDKEYTGNFIEWEGQSLSAKMTEDHRVYYNNTKWFRDLRSIAVKHIPKSAKIPNGWGYIGGKANVTPEYARLIAAYQCDGTEGSRNTVKFHFHKDRKFMRLEQLAIENNAEYKRNGEYVSITYENAFLFPKRAGSYLLTWPIESLKAYLEELPHWDGYFGPTYISLSSKDKEHLDWIKTCNRLIGVGGNIQKPQTSGFGTTIYTLQFNNRLLATLSSIKERYETFETNRVYCPTVPSKAFYIRRHGKISVTGNSNYFGKPYTISNEIKVPQKLVSDFQESYFKIFPCIRLMHEWVKEQLLTKSYLVNVFGRRRDFFDRADSAETLRAAIAFLFQSATADDLNLGLWRVWKYQPKAQLLLQLHDAIYFQFSEEENEQEFIHSVQKLMDVKLSHKGRDFIVPTEALTGYNLGHRYKRDENGNKKEVNPRGLDEVKYVQ